MSYKYFINIEYKYININIKYKIKYFINIKLFISHCNKNNKIFKIGKQVKVKKMHIVHFNENIYWITRYWK